MAKLTFEKLVRMKDIALTGINFTKDPYDLERFQELLTLTTELMGDVTDLKPLELYTQFCEETGYPTPKVGTRAAIFEDDKILLVKESLDGLWAMPGGWMDTTETVRTNTIKEVKEETGLDVRITKLVSVQDGRMINPKIIHNIVKLFILCEAVGGAFVQNIETLDMGYFALDALPPLSLYRTNPEQIAECYEAYKAEKWETTFD